MQPTCDQFIIAGVQFRLHAAAILEDPAAAVIYHSFRSSPISPDLAVDVDVSAEPPPDLSTAIPVFESQHAWRLLRSDDRLFVVREDAQRTPVLTLQADSRWHTLRAWLHASLFRRAADGASLRLHPLSYPLDQLVLMHRLAFGQGIVLHATAAVADGRAHVFVGPCGHGKTTLARKLHAEGALVLSDDRVVVRFQSGQWLVHGTPWAGEGGYRDGRAFPLAALYALPPPGQHQTGASIDTLLRVASVPWYEPASCAALLGSLDKLLRHGTPIPFPFRLDQPVLPSLSGDCAPSLRQNVN